MADIKCPVCGNENNEHATECIYCGAILNRSLNQSWRKPTPESVEDMLASLRGAGNKASETTPQTGSAESAGDIEPADEVNDEDQSTSDLLNRLRDFTFDQDAATDTSPETADDNLPDWLKELDNWQPPADNANIEDISSASSEPVDLPLDENILPQWIDTSDVNSEPADHPETPEEYGSEAMKAEVLSDWLSSQMENSSTPEEANPDDAENLPVESIIELPPIFEEQEIPQNILPDLEIPEQPEPVSSDSTVPMQEDETGTPEEETGTLEEETGVSEEVSGTLEEEISEPEDETSELEEEIGRPEEETGTPEETILVKPGSEYPGDAENIAVSEGDNLNEWLGDLQTGNFPQIFDTTEEETTEEPSNATPPFVNNDLKVWMEINQPEINEQEQDNEAESAPIPSETLPEWMQNITPAKVESSQSEKASPEETLSVGTPKAGTPQTETPDAGTPQAEIPKAVSTPEEISSEPSIPKWLAALQPVDGILGDQQKPVSSNVVEEAGPLAGIPGVLPVIEAAAFFRKPPLYSAHVDVNEKQRFNAAKLENMLSEEKQVIKKKRSQRKTPYALIRALIGILLIAVMLVPIAGPTSLGLETLSANSGVTESGVFRAAIDALPEGSTVLLAVEYMPGYDGELSTAAMSTMDLLMKRNAHIAVVSTNASGPVLAENLKNELLAANPDLLEQYSQRDWFINLGYLPGETLSLQELAANLRQTALYGISSGLENRPVWDSAGLINIQSLDDFSMLILVTDTTETARAWIEQVQPSITDVPFLIVSSAQASPMLQPYVASGQVQGLVSGMGGGISLREDAQQSKDNTGMDRVSFQLGVAVIIVIILIGIIIEIIRSLFGPKRLDQEVS